VAEQVGGRAATVVSILGSTPVASVRAAYPDSAVFRMLPSVPVQIRQGVTCYAVGEVVDRARESEVVELFGRLGPVVPVEDRLIDTAMGLMSCAPAYVALLVEAQVDAGVQRGLGPGQAAEMVVQTFAGTAALLRERGMDTLAVRREVTSPGGATARGLAALERAGVRAAFLDAIDAVLDPPAP
jgi:pyrroline-5-carboxylate reductase